MEKLENGLKTLFFQEKPVKAILKLFEKNLSYASEIAREINCTYAHTLKILSTLQQSGLVKFTREGRIKLAELTQEGKELATSFKKSFSLLRKLKKVKGKKSLKKQKEIKLAELRKYESQLKQLHKQLKFKKIPSEQIPTELKWLRNMKRRIGSSTNKRKTSLIKLLQKINKGLQEQTIG